MMSLNEDAWNRGFEAKCAELNVKPDELIKVAQGMLSGDTIKTLFGGTATGDPKATGKATAGFVPAPGKKTSPAASSARKARNLPTYEGNVAKANPSKKNLDLAAAVK